MITSLTNREHTLRGTGLTKKNLEERVVVALGFYPGELLPPYNQMVSEEAARRVLDYIRKEEKKGRTVKTYASTAELHEPISDFKPSPVEVVGCFAEQCVYNAAEYLLQNDYFVLLNIQKIIPSGYITSSQMKESFRQRLLFGQENIKYRQLGEKMLFYRPWRSRAKLEGII